MWCNVGLFSHLYVSTKEREADLGEFFSLEIQGYPPSLSDYGKIRLGVKSDLLKLSQDAKTKRIIPCSNVNFPLA